MTGRKSGKNGNGVSPGIRGFFFGLAAIHLRLHRLAKNLGTNGKIVSAVGNMNEIVTRGEKS